MARIRSVKPEFWDDEAIGLLSRDARLLYIATWNMADDEGLLRWTASYIKANAFMYDDDFTVPDVTALMAELSAAHLILPYIAGKARQSLGWVVQFGKHQRPNRPQPSRLPPPSIQNGDVITAYVRRDRNTCHLCGHETSTDPKDRRLWPSLDHLKPRSQGGSDYPSNVKLSHLGCNTARRDRDVESFTDTPTGQRMADTVNDSLSEAVSDSVTCSPPEGRGGVRRGGEQDGEGDAAPLPLRLAVETPPSAAPLGAALDLVTADPAPTAATVVAAYIDECRVVGQVIDDRAKGRIARESAQLLSNGSPHGLLVDAARALARNGYADIGAEARRIHGQRARPNAAQQRTSDNLAVIEFFRQQEGA